MATLYLGLGTNLGNKKENLQRAVNEINSRIGKVTSLSSFYETAPWGFSSENSFLNAACCVNTELSPIDALEQTQQIERELGRLHKSVNGIYADRLIDIDLLLYDDLCMNTERLTLPHPGIDKRLFVIEPLAEIAPDVNHPQTGITMKNILEKLHNEN